MHKIRLLCGSIAVTIATHKNSKIQRLSEFFLMRIGACFATFAILSYTKIIDNNWYLRHLFSYFLFGIQWGTGDLNRVVSKTINLPLSVNSILFAAAQDGGDGAFSLGTTIEDRTLRIYQSAAQNPGGVLALIGYHYIAMCQG